ncbi:unnamed protein product [Gordionus sp. m RMFG-2023]|uniref:protoporphyrinogen oxidase-like isoform X2 n=1 Tax=Gordionus sp. m RMFG-2023 TaxID=3053472 RepID=UPI0030E34D92
MKNIVILGGGISGLSSAYYLLKSTNAKVTIIEKSKSIGGWIKSHQYDNNIVLERGPRTIRAYGFAAKSTLNLMHNIGLDDKIIGIKSNDPRATNRYIYYNNHLHKLPSNILSLFKRNSLLKNPLLYYIMKELFTYEKSMYNDKSVYDFFTQTFGKEIADFIIDPLCKGIYAGNSKKLSSKSCFKDLFDYKNLYGSVILGTLVSPKKIIYEKNDCHLIKKIKDEKWTLWYLQDGLETLIQNLYNFLIKHYPDRFNLIINCPVKSININQNLKIELQNQNIVYDYIISAMPSNALSDILDYSCITNTKNSTILLPLNNELNKISFVDVVVVNLIYKIENITEINLLPKGFGYLLPSKENTPLLGTIFDWCLRWKQHNINEEFPRKINFTCMIGGAWMENFFHNVDANDPKLYIDFAIKSIKSHIGIKSDPIFYDVNMLKKCIPQYHVGHSDILNNIREIIENNNLPIRLVGASYDGISVNDCIHSAKIMCDKISTSF